MSMARHHPIRAQKRGHSGATRLKAAEWDAYLLLKLAHLFQCGGVRAGVADYSLPVLNLARERAGGVAAYFFVNGNKLLLSVHVLLGAA